MGPQFPREISELGKETSLCDFKGSEMKLLVEPEPYSISDFKLSVGYDWEAAVDYARRYWDIPCSDGLIAVSGNRNYVAVPNGTRFVHEFDKDGNDLKREHAEAPDRKHVVKWKELNDCTHFISCCIGRPPNDDAGGIPLDNEIDGIYGSVNTSYLVDYLLRKHFVTKEGEKTRDEGIINKLKPGDLIAYFDGREYSHLALYLGDGKIACHSYSTYDDPDCTWDSNWDRIDDGSWTFLHFRLRRPGAGLHLRRPRRPANSPLA